MEATENWREFRLFAKRITITKSNTFNGEFNACLMCAYPIFDTEPDLQSKEVPRMVEFDVTCYGYLSQGLHIGFLLSPR